MLRLLICVLLFISYSLKSQTIHFISIVDTNVFDIGKANEVSFHLVEDEVAKIAGFIGYKLKYYNSSEDKFSIKNVKSILESIKVLKNDLIILYSSTHGFRYKEQRSIFPRLSFVRDADAETIKAQSISIEFMVDELIKKDPKFILAISDACNVDINISQNSPETVVEKEEKDFVDSRTLVNSDRVKQESFQYLFREFEGIVIASSSQAGEYSWTSSIKGGVFTNALITSINESVLSGKDVSWLNVLSTTQSKVISQSEAEVSQIQTPVYGIYSKNEFKNYYHSLSKYKENKKVILVISISIIIIFILLASYSVVRKRNKANDRKEIGKIDSDLLKRLIISNKVLDSLEILKDVTFKHDKKLNTEIVVLIAELKRVESNIRSGILSKENERREINRINKVTLEIIDKLDEKYNSS